MSEPNLEMNDANSVLSTSFQVRPGEVRPGLVWAVSFAVWTFVSLAATASAYEIYHLANHGVQLRTIAGIQFSAIFTYIPITPFAFAFAIRYPIQRHNWMKRCLLHLVAGLSFTLLHMILKAITGYGYWDPQAQAWSSAIWNSQLHVFRNPWLVFKSMFFASAFDDISGAYLPIVLIAHIVSYYQKMREREGRATQLEAQLTKARLQALKSQLQPHFLFNTLHSISSLMLTDVVAADRMMTSLSDLLRMSLEDNGIQEITLDREIEFLNAYLDIEKTRFEDRLRVVLEVAPECLDAHVPHLLLQPLVENAVRHGVSKQSSNGEIQIVACRDSRDLHIIIRDNGPGLSDGYDESSRHGLGLRLTRERLAALYGSEQSCDIRNARDGGAEVSLRMPFSAAIQTHKDEVAAHI